MIGIQRRKKVLPKIEHGKNQLLYLQSKQFFQLFNKTQPKGVISFKRNYKVFKGDQNQSNENMGGSFNDSKKQRKKIHPNKLDISVTSNKSYGLNQLCQFKKDEKNSEFNNNLSMLTMNPNIQFCSYDNANQEFMNKNQKFQKQFQVKQETLEDNEFAELQFKFKEYQDYHSQILPRYMKGKGSMCITDLWNDKLKMKLMKTYSETTKKNKIQDYMNSQTPSPKSNIQIPSLKFKKNFFQSPLKKPKKINIKKESKEDIQKDQDEDFSPTKIKKKGRFTIFSEEERLKMKQYQEQNQIFRDMGESISEADENDEIEGKGKDAGFNIKVVQKFIHYNSSYSVPESEIFDNISQLSQTFCDYKKQQPLKTSKFRYMQNRKIDKINNELKKPQNEMIKKTAKRADILNNKCVSLLKETSGYLKSLKYIQKQTDVRLNQHQKKITKFKQMEKTQE